LARLAAAGTLRVLLVTTVEATRDDVEAILEGWSGEVRLYWVTQPNLALSRAQDVMPHAILVDGELGSTDPVHLIRQMAVRLPGAAVVSLVEWDAMAKASQAVLAGARAFVVKPLKADELRATLRQVLSQDGSDGVAEEVEAVQRLGEVLVFCAPKGGTGRTTMALNTAVAIHQHTEEPVVLVDADYAAPALDVALNLQTDLSVVDLLPRLTRLDKQVIDSVLAEHASGIKVLLAPPPADLSHPITLPQVEQILVSLKAMFPWVVVDLGLPMDETAFGFLDGADRIVVSVLPEMIGLRNTRLLVDQLHDRGYPPERIWLVLNRSNLKGGVSVEDIEARLRVKVRSVIPDDQPLVTHSVNRGVPVTMSHPRSALAKGYRELALDLVESVVREREAEGERAAGKGGLLGRLFGSSSA